MYTSTNQCGYIHSPDEWEPAVDSAINRLPQERWECPHEAVGKQSRCLFHLSSDDREELDINERDVAKGFLQALQSEDGTLERIHWCIVSGVES